MRRTTLLFALLLVTVAACRKLPPKWDAGLQGLTEEESRICLTALRASFELIEGSPGPLYIRVLDRDPDRHFLDQLPYSEAPVLSAADYEPGRGHLLEVVEMAQPTGDTAAVVVEDYVDALQARRIACRLERRQGEWVVTERALVGGS